jgi:hypothetical protein
VFAQLDVDSNRWEHAEIWDRLPENLRPGFDVAMISEKVKERLLVRVIRTFLDVASLLKT